MTARKPAARKTTAAPTVKLSGDMVEVPSEAFTNEATAAEPMARTLRHPPTKLPTPSPSSKPKRTARGTDRAHELHSRQVRR
jgi:hypothetical protein